MMIYDETYSYNSNCNCENKRLTQPYIKFIFHCRSQLVITKLSCFLPYRNILGGFHWIIHYIATWIFFKVRFSFRFNQHPESWPFQSLSGCAINPTKQTIFQYDHWRGVTLGKMNPNTHVQNTSMWYTSIQYLIDVYIYTHTIDVSLNGGTPSYHPFIARIFHEINHPASYWVAILGNPPCIYIYICKLPSGKLT